MYYQWRKDNNFDSIKFSLKMQFEQFFKLKIHIFTLKFLNSRKQGLLNFLFAVLLEMLLPNVHHHAVVLAPRYVNSFSLKKVWLVLITNSLLSHK